MGFVLSKYCQAFGASTLFTEHRKAQCHNKQSMVYDELTSCTKISTKFNDMAWYVLKWLHYNGEAMCSELEEQFHVLLKCTKFALH